MLFGLPFGFQIFYGALPFSMAGNAALQTTRNLRHKEWYRIFNKEAI
jgi:hypothetical protein